MNTIDVLAIGPHPDDAEIGVGGLLHKLAVQGARTAILDLTRGELATRGTVAERESEAADAARILGVSRRLNAGLPDGSVANTPGQRLEVIRHIRDLRPRHILAPMTQDRHPDHDAAHDLVRDSAYLAGLRKIDTRQEPHRAISILYYRVYGDPTRPTLIVDVSDHWNAKVDAMRAHVSQLHNPAYTGESTFVSSESFWQTIELRARYWGSRIGAAYAEPLYSDEPLAVALPPGWME